MSDVVVNPVAVRVTVAPDTPVPVALVRRGSARPVELGSLVMACGGGLSLSDRRLRVGVAQRAKIPAGAQAAS